MQIKIEVDLKPEELQRFLGLPDVAGMREEVALFIRERIANDPGGFLRDNLKHLRKNPVVRRILDGDRGRRKRGGKDAPDEDADQDS